TPSACLYRWAPDPLISKVEDWLKPAVAASLKKRALEILDKTWSLAVSKGTAPIVIEASVFVDRLAQRISNLRNHVYTALNALTSKNRSARRRLRAQAAAQGLLGFVEDLNQAIAGQYSYRIIGQLLFYFALRRK